MNYIDKCEINATRHCNNHCSNCNHGSPLADAYYMDPETLRRDLAALAPILHIGFLCIQGGEPLLHPRVIELMEACRQSGIADQYGMLSNGRLLDKISDEFFAQAGRMRVGDKKFELRVTVYPNFHAGSLAPSIQKASKAGAELRVGHVGAFLTLFKEWSDGGAAVWKICQWKVCYTIHEGHFYHCPLAAFFPKQFWNLPEHIDGLPLDGITNEKLAGFLNRAEPLASCAHCSGSIGQWKGWRETFKAGDWIKEAQSV